jgi:ATP-dependent Lhr-like helicase
LNTIRDAAPAGDPLASFDPLVAQWFTRSVGEPTEVQARAWPAIARGAHVLVSAPTGTGKTLAAFLWGIDRLVRGVLPPGGVRILYVSPLKALNNDIQKNLLGPLEGLRQLFQQAGREFPPIRVLTRSGDTPPGERRRMLSRPPEILITTPESLNLILSSPNASAMLAGVATLILDEVHAVASTKRGTHLMTAVERLARTSGEFQRIALSATVRPLSTVADLVGGFTLERSGGQPVYRKRPIEIVNCPMAKRYEISVSFPLPGNPPLRPGRAGFAAPSPTELSAETEETLWSALTLECRRIIRENRSTLFFVNSRRHAEKLARFINEGAEGQLAWSHHGSLSREIRLVVEQRLKNGELKAIVATSSLELGIDIGVLDRVILIQTPFSVSSAVQRIGRAGHRIGSPSRAVIYALHGMDLADAAVMARSVLAQDIEEVSPVLCPLDVLAQVIVSMTAMETWKRDDLYDTLRSSFPFNSLSREHFDLVIAMLAGRYEESRLRELSPLVAVDALEGTVQARSGALQRLYSSGGTIPDRGSFSMRTAGGKALIGELDEEFVWERSVGDSFFFGTQGWRIEKIDHQNVEVAPSTSNTAMAPFWKAEERNRSFHISRRIAEALEDWTGRLEDPAFPALLERDFSLEPPAALELVRFLARQREATGTDLPHRHHLLVEHTRDGPGAAVEPALGAAAARDAAPGAPSGTLPGLKRIVLHTLWGGRVNRPYSLALAAAWEEELGYPPEMIQDDDAILLLLPEDEPAARIVSLVTPENLERLLRKKLESSGFFGARFRENASRALLLPKSAANRRMPLWFTRLRAKNLFAVVSKYDDFPMIVETWRTCLRDEFDMESLRLVLEEVASGKIRVSEAVTSAPSPFCGGLLWKQTNTFMYRDDTPRAGGQTALRGDLIRELVLSSSLRPQIKPAAASELLGKLQRTAPGYAPRGGVELLEWVKERVLIPRGEWDELLAACQRDHGTPAADLMTELEDKIVFLGMPAEAAAARESVTRIMRAKEEDDEALASLLSQWLRFYGPVEPSFAQAALGPTDERFQAALEDLVEEELVVVDRLVAGSEAAFLCDRENLERLLRMARSQARPSFTPHAAELLPLYLARRQGLTRRGAGPDDMKEAWEKLFGFGLPARIWEEEVLPARLQGYRGRWLDSLFSEAGLVWFGCGRERIAFCFAEDLELFTGPSAEERSLDAVFPEAFGKYGFWELADRSGLSTQELSKRLWHFAWEGLASNDLFQTVRRGIDGRFQALETGFDAHRRAGVKARPSFSRWQASRPAAGYWFRLPRAAERDALEEEERNRDRIRQVLQRFGVVYREALENELAPLRWGALFRSLRIMELSGEVLSGRFFEGIPGLQFASPQAFEELRGELPEDAVYWMNAVDPASLCGTGLGAFKGILPPRVPSTHLVFHGRALVLVSRRQGRELELRFPPQDPRISEYLGFIRELVGRDLRPLSALHVEKINDEAAVRSPYREALLSFGFVEDYKRLTFRAGV